MWKKFVHSSVRSTILWVSFPFSPCLFILGPLSPLHPETPSFFFILFPSLSVYREWCLGSHVTFCLNTIAGVCHWPFFFERGLVSRVTGNGGTTSLFSPAAPSRLRCSDLVSLSLFLSVAVSSSGCGSGSLWARHTHTVRGLSRSSSSPSSPFSSGRQLQSPLDCRRWVKQMTLFV